MATATTLLTLSFEESLTLSDEGAAFVDLRRIDDYLDVHVPASLELLYEFGPGMAARARDCLPLELPLILLDLGEGDAVHAAASLRGKGFTVLGRVEDAINQWARIRGRPASTDVVSGSAAPEGAILNVGDPGARRLASAITIPIETLWPRLHEIAHEPRVTVVAGAGVRAALAVGMLERAGVDEVLFWRT